MATINRKDVQEIKDYLNKYGGIFVTSRQVGKSQALLELLHENKDSYLLTFSSAMAKELQKRYKKLYDDGRERFIISDSTKISIEDCYIDEYFFHNELYQNFKGAVSTMKFPIKIKRFDNLDKNTKKEFKMALDKISYKKEYTLKFD